MAKFNAKKYEAMKKKVFGMDKKPMKMKAKSSNKNKVMLEDKGKR